jgi:large subunit ribosomal protein L1
MIMAKHGKKYNEAVKKSTKPVYTVDQAMALVKDAAYAKFDEAIDVNVNLGIDATKGDQTVRGSVLLPHTDKKVRVIVFAKGDYAAQAEKAGADLVGAEDLVEKISGGWLDFDYAVATPDLMGMVGRLAKLLGPRGLLPNKKVGTVTFDVESIINDLKKGRAFFKNDKSGLVHFSIGKVSLDANKLRENLETFVKALVAAKPSAAKGNFVKKLTISSTMGIGVSIAVEELLH